MDNKTKSDGFLFYSLGIISFLESAAPIYVENLCLLYKQDAEFADWLRNTWSKEESRHGQATREIIQFVWPEFNWEGAFADYCATIPTQTTEHLNPSLALEALSRCVTETETAMIYRTFASYTDDRQLKQLFCELSSDEVRHYKVFKSVFQRYRNGLSVFTCAWTMIRRSQKVKHRDLAMAFEKLNDYWLQAPPFQRLDYRRFNLQAAGMIHQHFPTATAERMLLNPLNLPKTRSNWIGYWVKQFITWQFAGFKLLPNPKTTNDTYLRYNGLRHIPSRPSNHQVSL